MTDYLPFTSIKPVDKEFSLGLTYDPAFHLDRPDAITLSGSAGFGQTVIIKLVVKK